MLFELDGTELPLNFSLPLAEFIGNGNFTLRHFFASQKTILQTMAWS